MAFERTWAVIFVFLISLCAMAILFFLAVSQPPLGSSKAWTGAMFGALAGTLGAGSVSIGHLTKIATRDGARPLPAAFP